MNVMELRECEQRVLFDLNELSLEAAAVDIVEGREEREMEARKQLSQCGGGRMCSCVCAYD